MKKITRVGEELEPSARLEKVWSPVIRVWHWALAICVITGWWLGKTRSFTTIELHFYFGYVIGGLVLLRLIYGIFGPRQVRLVNLIPKPQELFDYLGKLPLRKPGFSPGHNPLGAISVLLMLIALAVQVIVGLFSMDDTLFAQGPLSSLLSERTSLTFTRVHNLGADILLILVSLHVAAILFYWIWKRENLVWPMITGWKMIQRKR